MSNTLRWLIAIVLFLLGIAGAAFALFGGAFSTIACQKTPSDWVYYVLIVDAVIILAAATIPAVMLIRKIQSAKIVIALVLGIVLSCAGYGVYFYFLGQSC